VHVDFHFVDVTAATVTDDRGWAGVGDDQRLVARNVTTTSRLNLAGMWRGHAYLDLLNAREIPEIDAVRPSLHFL